MHPASSALRTAQHLVLIKWHTGAPCAFLCYILLSMGFVWVLRKISWIQRMAVSQNATGNERPDGLEGISVLARARFDAIW